MDDRVLFVDDNLNTLESLQRILRRRFNIETCPGGKERLAKVAGKGPYSVIVADLRMPKMDGIQFLSRVRQIAPDSVRMMLTGYPDMQTAIAAVNEGSIFRFLTKPCPRTTLVEAIAAGIRQYRLVMTERELTKKTFGGSVKVLSKVLSLLNPTAFERTLRIVPYIKEIGFWMGLNEVWKLEIAATLSQIGCIVLSESLLEKAYQGVALDKREAKVFKSHPLVASSLIMLIPHMEEIAEIVALQEKHFDGRGIPSDSRKGEEIPLGSRILKVLVDFDTLRIAGMSKDRAIEELKAREGWYDPTVLGALEAVERIEAKYYNSKAVTLKELHEGMVLRHDLLSAEGMLISRKGQEVTRPLLRRLRNFAKTSGIKEPIHVLVPFETKR